MLRGTQPLSLCDWPGKISLVLFVGGCNLRCPTCHNKRIAFHADTLPELSLDQALEPLLRNKAWYQGIVVSGGEPTNCDMLTELLQALSGLRQDGIAVRLDTNGMRPACTRYLLQENLIDAVAMDVKGPYAKYPDLTGTDMSPDTVRRNIERHFSLHRKYPGVFQFRLTRVPALTDDDIEEVRTYLPAGCELTLQPYRRLHNA